MNKSLPNKWSQIGGKEAQARDLVQSTNNGRCFSMLGESLCVSLLLESVSKQCSQSTDEGNVLQGYEWLARQHTAWKEYILTGMPLHTHNSMHTRVETVNIYFTQTKDAFTLLHSGCPWCLHLFSAVPKDSPSFFGTAGRGK